MKKASVKKKTTKNFGMFVLELDRVQEKYIRLGACETIVDSEIEAAIFLALRCGTIKLPTNWHLYDKRGMKQAERELNNALLPLLEYVKNVARDYNYAASFCYRPEN